MNETLNVNLNNLTEEERNTLLALAEKSVKEPKVQKPEMGDKYFYVGATGNIYCTDWRNNKSDNDVFNLNNYFRTEEEAKFTVEKLKVIAELKRFAQEHNTKEINWNDPRQNKYYFYYDCTDKKIDIGFVCCMKRNAIYFSSKEIAEQAIKAIGEERIKKYYLEVE